MSTASRRITLCFQRLTYACLVSLAVLPLQAKDAALTAIEVYDSDRGPAYVQISDVLINGKAEVRTCGSSPTIGKATYGQLAKLVLAAGDTLDYGKNGVLTLIRDGQPACVVPSNVKLEKTASLSPADLASQAMLQARTLGSASAGGNSPPPLKPGVKLVFVVEPSEEMGEYLCADRAAKVPVWQDYLARFPSAPRTASAKQNLAALFAQEGESHLAAYRQTAQASAPAYDELKTARTSGEQALAVVPAHPAATAVIAAIRKEAQELALKGQNELQSYRKALSAAEKGYAHLPAANKFADGAVQADPANASASRLQLEARAEQEKIEAAIRSAQAKVETPDPESAWTVIAPYRSFASEESRVDGILKAVYRFHLSRAQSASDARDWKTAIDELQLAAKVDQSEEVKTALLRARRELAAEVDQNAVQEALQKSQDLAQQRRFIEAYDMLVNLPETQRAQVKEAIDKLQPDFVQSASQTANELRRAHDPIKGLADELGIEQAYVYLQRASALSPDPTLRDRLEILADRLTQYYLQQAQHYLGKPLGSGAGVGWSYLNRARPYKAANLNAVLDEMTKNASAYQMRSKLSIGVSFRDQTSRRDSAGFAEQLADAMATGLEGSGLAVKVIRPGESPALEPNFQLVGDVLQHRLTETVTEEPKESRYRAAVQEVPNEAWNTLNRQYEAANVDLQGDQRVLEQTITRGKKKEIADATDKVTQDKKVLADLRTQLDAIPKSLLKDVVKPYNYTQKSVDLGAVVQLQFRVNDLSGTQVVNTTPVVSEKHTNYTILENVKSEDLQGVQAQGTVPDKAQFLTDVENETRDRLIKTVKDRIMDIPVKILEQASRRAQAGDLDGAAESYILYLNSAPPAESPERKEAARFLREQYNIRLEAAGSPAPDSALAPATAK